MRLLPAAILMAGLIGSGAARAGSFTFSFSDLGTTVATGSFSYAASATGVVSFDELTAFNIVVAGVDYTLADVLPLTDYVQFAFDTSTDSFIANPNACGFAGCGFDEELGAINATGTYGFYFEPVPGEYEEYSTQTLGEIDTLTITAVPEPASWVVAVAGLAAMGMAGFRRRGRAVAA